ncbi:antibiotic biosynthesis monooxygenase [Cereibacter sphaeroides]|uniref:antibiotic biosynthesis monooxygenase n=1 Tax=Cereibacter sphaeroides TaxID=1063 RepID=UPI000191CE6A|nr:antibiotic biosynthesis monooxygenase [Cereibacter sphaeroides]ACM03533.1 Antibiotic biosynthesis monooxygenase [Cereibacter sphaeroides KD131]RHZ99393.1 autoinducer-2 (AI-2) modifying protein LsrG [Cereibacter sphaeroides]
MLIQLVNIKVQDGTRETFLEAFRLNCDGTRKEPGNIRFDLLHDPADENNFFVYEIFESEAALDAHRQTDHYQTCVKMIDPITLGGRSKTYFTPVMVQERASA